MCFLCNNFQKPFLRFVSERLTVRRSSLLCFGCITIFCWNRRLNMRRSPSPIFLFNIINLCSVTMKSNTLKFYVLWTMHWHFVWHNIKAKVDCYDIPCIDFLPCPTSFYMVGPRLKGFLSVWVSLVYDWPLWYMGPIWWGGM